MRALSERAARNCEEAREPVCKCRCGGALHGAKRAGDDTPRAWLEALPEDDPHHVPSPAQRHEAKKRREEEKRKAHAAAMSERRRLLNESRYGDPYRS